MLNVNFDPYPVLTTERLVLRNIQESDKEYLFAIRSNKENMRYIPRPLAVVVDDVLPLIEMIQNSVTANERINWTITQKGTDRLIGMCGFVKISPDNCRAEVGYVLNLNYHGHGIMTEALNAVVKYGFDTMNLRTIEAVIHPDNVASCKLVEKCGFTRDAYFKDYNFHNGKFVDAVVYSLITPHR